jgi:hypothetical protein
MSQAHADLAPPRTAYALRVATCTGHGTADYSMMHPHPANKQTCTAKRMTRMAIATPTTVSLVTLLEATCRPAEGCVGT